MINLTPKEVESCRRLKYYTEKRLAEELYDAIDNPAKHDAQAKKFIGDVREMSKYAIDYLRKIIVLLKDSGVKNDEKINKMLREAGPLSVYYSLDRASGDRGDRDEKYKNIEKISKDKIEKYKKDIRTLEKADRNLNKNINTLLYKISKKEASGGDFDNCKLDDSVKDIVSVETKEIVDSNNLSLKVLSKEDKNDLAAWMVMEGWVDDDGYFEVKKHLDLDISRLYHKIEWQQDYARGLERRATSEFSNKKLEIGDLDTLSEQSDKLSPSDCSDIFRLFGTIMEELDKLKKEEWENLNKYYTEKVVEDRSINLDNLKFCIQLQSILRETSGLDVKKLFPKMPPKLARNIVMPDEYQIDRGERFVKYCDKCKGPHSVSADEKKCRIHSDAVITDRIEQQLKCKECGAIIKKYFEAGKQAKEKPIEHRCRNKNCTAEKEWWCSKCMKKKKSNEIKTLSPSETRRSSPTTCCLTCGDPVSMEHISKFEPIGTRESGEGGVKPFWKDEIRARWRDTWSSTFILEYNSVVRAIDRTFGLAEAADISGTTADSIFGMEAVMNLKGFGEGGIGTGVKAELWQKQYDMSQGYAGSLIILPLITMVKHGHHAILECALTFALTGYIDAYHIGEYTTLWPKGSAKSGALWDILKKWEESPSNERILIERDENGFVTGGQLLDRGSRLGDYEFSDITKINYQRYINIFLPLRDKMRDNEKIDVDTIIQLMNKSEQELNNLELDILKENGKRLKDDKNYNDFAEGLEEYSKDESIHASFQGALEDLSRKYPKKEFAAV